MPLDHYVTLGRLRTPGQPADALGAMTFGEDLGWGSSVADVRTRSSPAFVDRGGNFHRHRQLLHPRVTPRRSSATTSGATPRGAIV